MIDLLQVKLKLKFKALTTTAPLHTVFTWLNIAATIRHVLKFIVATIQGWHLLHLACVAAM